MGNTKLKRQHADLQNLDLEKESTFSPSEFMRSRHPDLFSDSSVVTSIALPKELFEYYLETLTNRKQEIEFEHFCRRLAEKEICPNLIPQTGPLGGGDSQVDTETYPVADQIALRWYEGIGREASKERWAFAFSAKRQWRSKADSDIEKIVNTNRGYERAFFITNQFVRDRTRVEVEEELKSKYGIPVRIYDRSWIIKCIYENNRLWLAAETLRIQELTQAVAKQTGPHDISRQEELRELEEQINDLDRYHGVEYQLAEDCFSAAMIARGLELPRVEVEGRFQRAVHIAERVGIRQQKLRIIYNHAWTEYWWYEDYETFTRLYDQVEALVIGSAQADDVELLVNLWQILHTALHRGFIKGEDGALSRRTITVHNELDRLASDERRPNNALQAKTNRLFIDLTEAMVQKKSIDPILENLKDVLKRSEGLLEYPITPTIKIIQELGDILTDIPKYDELLEVVIEVAEKRTSEGKAGQILLERGMQKIRSGKNYDAIKLIGRAQQKLAMEEYKSEWITSLVLCGLAYEAVGLLWAARANFLMATNQAFSEYTKSGKLNPPTLRYTQKLIWLELQLGRLPHVLSWMEFSSLIANLMAFEDDQKEKYQAERTLQDQVLAILLTKTDFWELKWLDFLPPVLDSMGLYSSWMTLLYILGYEDRLRDEKVISAEDSSESVLNLFGRLKEQPASKDLPEHPEFLNGSTVNLVSPVLGCTVSVTVTNHPTTLFLAENILGALEAFLATSFDSDILPYRSKLLIKIRTTDFLTGLPEYTVSEERNGEIEIRCPVEISKGNSEDRSKFRDWLQRIILDITFQVAVVTDTDSFVERVIKDERSFDRAIMFSDVEIAISNLLGDKPKVCLSGWEQEVMEKFPLQREVPWDFDIKNQVKSLTDKTPLKFGEDNPPESLFDMDKVRHGDRQVLSLINIPLWDQANWKAVGYIYGGNETPILALAFKNPMAANQIFKEWREILGEVDQEDKLRIVIVTGVSKKYPLNYKVLVTTNFEKVERTEFNHFVITSRFMEMTTQSQVHLQNFLSEYKRIGRYILAPARLNAEAGQPEPIGNPGIGKYHLVVRPAWQIGLNDPDISVIQEGDDPLIPDGEKNAPVIRALKRFEPRKKRKRH